MSTVARHEARILTERRGLCGCVFIAFALQIMSVYACILTVPVMQRRADAAMRAPAGA